MRGTRITAIGLLAVVGGALLGMGASATATAATTMPITFDLGVVLPGESRIMSERVTIDTDSIVASAVWIERSGVASWDAELCATGGDCTDISALQGASLRAGEYDLSASITIPADAPRGTVSAAAGVLRLTAMPGHLGTGEQGELAATGSAVPWVVVGAGALTATVGALLLATRRRRVGDS
ncbi:MAG TPA: hypothetical protein VNT50_11195 [Microbacterium sp.]|uniref:hypothetical protein n=1 Tax=Microbacterium sp. TaxID=51671 RepID=UPI002CDA5A14|nr:hypothetical protein [Microbacterium sp.]HWI32049.1 hypothetical protein [Microbacterium sp.]